MMKIYIRENKKMIEIGEAAKQLAKEKAIPYNAAFCLVFNEASCSIAFVEKAIVKNEPVYDLATQADFYKRLQYEKEKLGEND